jgi:hypothetical protein
MTHKQDDDINTFQLLWGLFLLVLIGWFWLTPLEYVRKLFGKKDDDNG